MHSRRLKLNLSFFLGEVHPKPEKKAQHKLRLVLGIWFFIPSPFPKNKAGLIFWTPWRGFHLTMEGLTCRLSSFFLESWTIWRNLQSTYATWVPNGASEFFFSVSRDDFESSTVFLKMVKIGQPNPMWWVVVEKTQLSFQPLFKWGRSCFEKKTSWFDIKYFNCEVETSTNCMPKETTATAAAFQLCRSSGISSCSWPQQGNWDNKNDHWLSSA